jgi:chloramphenicol O-acetyltransferase type A
MNKKIIDIESYNRKDHYNYFKDIGYPYVGLTVNVDITEFTENLKRTGNPFYLSFVYQVVAAANAVPEFRRRIENDSIVEYDYCLASCVILKDDDTFGYLTLDCNQPLEDFLIEGKAKIEEAKKTGNIEDDENVGSLYFLSSVPWVTYTSLIQAVPIPADSNPRITWGKYFEQDGKIKIPVSVLVHHALVDGFQISQFYKKLDELVTSTK